MPRHSTQNHVTRICETCETAFLFYACPSFIKRGYGRFCSLACRDLCMTIPLIDRFFRYVGKKQVDGCIPWVGCTNEDGYGVIGSGTRKGKMVLAHRVSYQLFIEPIPDDICVLHRCDYPPCVNPVHFFLGTRADNSADMVAKERGRKRVPGSRRYTAESAGRKPR